MVICGMIGIEHSKTIIKNCKDFYRQGDSLNMTYFEGDSFNN